MHVIEEVPPEKGKGLASNADKALISPHRQPHRQAKLASKQISSTSGAVNGLNGIGGENLEILLSRGRLADARKWFAHRGWDVLPQGRRGQRILSWGADHAYMASPTNPERGVRRWCRRWAPWLKPADLDKLATTTKRSNKRWNHDQCATVLEITVHDRETLRLRFIGASDDPNYETRLALKREKAAARGRRFRAAHSTGAKRGRPALSPEDRIARSAARVRKYRAKRSTGGKRGRPKSEGVPAWMAAGFNSKRTYQRHKRVTVAAQNGTENASRKNASRDISNNRKRYGIKRYAISVPQASFTDLDTIDFKRFGISAIRVMRGPDVLRAWNRIT
jgi:hypothetical protein